MSQIENLCNTVRQNATTEEGAATMTDSRPRAGQPALERFLRDEVARRFGAPKRFLEETGFDKTTYYRVAGDRAVTSETSYRALEGKLEFPRYLLDFIADLDVENIESIDDERFTDLDQKRVAVHLVRVEADRIAAEAEWDQDDAERAQREAAKRKRAAS